MVLPKQALPYGVESLAMKCLEQALTNPIVPNELEIMKENRRLRAELEEAQEVFLSCKKTQDKLYLRYTTKIMALWDTAT